MKFTDKIRNFFYAITHANELVTENERLRSMLADQNVEIENLNLEIYSLKSGTENQEQENTTKEYDEEWANELIPEITAAKTLPTGWCWAAYGDGSGSLRSPDGKHFFSYDLQPYHNLGGIEYQENGDSRYGPFWGSMDEFKRHAESVISSKYLSQEVQQVIEEQHIDLTQEIHEPVPEPEWDFEM